MLEELKGWISIVSGGVSLVTLFYVWITSGAKATAIGLTEHKKANDAVIAKLTELLDGHDARIQRIENEMQHLPDKDGLHRVELSVKDIQTQIASMAASAQATERTARRVEEFLLDQAKRS